MIHAYKILTRPVFYHQLPTIRGSVKEQAEGVIHLSAWTSIGNTLVRKFSDHKEDLILVKVDLEEVVRGGRVHYHHRFPSIRGIKPYIDEEAIVWARLLTIVNPQSGEFLTSPDKA